MTSPDNTVEPLYNGHFGTRYFWLLFLGLRLSEVKNIFLTPVGTKIFVLIMEVFPIVSLIRTVCLERFHFIHVLSLNNRSPSLLEIVL